MSTPAVRAPQILIDMAKTTTVLGGQNDVMRGRMMQDLDRGYAVGGVIQTMLWPDRQWMLFPFVPTDNIAILEHSNSRPLQIKPV
jgi:hypothetical protein